MGPSSPPRTGWCGVEKAGEDEGIGFSFSVNRLIVVLCAFAVTK